MDNIHHAFFIFSGPPWQYENKYSPKLIIFRDKKTTTFYVNSKNDKFIERTLYQVLESDGSVLTKVWEDLEYPLDKIKDFGFEKGIDHDLLFKPHQKQSSNYPGTRVQVNRAFISGERGVLGKTDEMGMLHSGVENPNSDENFVGEIEETKDVGTKREEKSKMDLEIKPKDFEGIINKIIRKNPEKKEEEGADADKSRRLIQGQRSLEGLMHQQLQQGRIKRQEKIQANQENERSFNEEMNKLKTAAYMNSFSSKAALAELILNAHKALNKREIISEDKEFNLPKLVGLKQQWGKTYLEYEIDDSFGYEFNYPLQSRDKEFRPKLENLQQRIQNFGPKNQTERNLKKAAYASMIVADEESVAGKGEAASYALSLGNEFMDIALSLIPGVSVGKDLYEVIWGKNLVTGNKLSLMETSFAILGIVTLGGSNVVKVGAKTGFKVIGKLTKYISLLTRRPLRKFTRGYTNAKKLYGTTLGNSIKTTEDLQKRLKRFKSFSQVINSEMRRVPTKKLIDLYVSVRRLGFKTSEGIKGFADLSKLILGNDIGAVGDIAKAIRKSYVREVDNLSRLATKMGKAGKSQREIAEEVLSKRNQLKVKYRNISPSNSKKIMEDRNLKKYGNKIGPNVDYFLKKGVSLEEIIEKAGRAGGQDMGL